MCLIFPIQLSPAFTGYPLHGWRWNSLSIIPSLPILSPYASPLPCSLLTRGLRSIAHRPLLLPQWRWAGASAQHCKLSPSSAQAVLDTKDLLFGQLFGQKAAQEPWHLASPDLCIPNPLTGEAGTGGCGTLAGQVLTVRMRSYD